MTLDGKVALVTGGGSGVGRASVFRFLKDGCRVIVADVNDANAGDAVREAGRNGYADRVHFVHVDVAREDDVSHAVAEAVRIFGGLDIMFNNAGVGGAFGAIEAIDAEDWDYTFGVLVRGVFFGIKHAVQVMRRQDSGGVILNTTSVAGLSAGAGPQAYSAAKAAVINLTASAAVELAVHRIRVNGICLGVISTPLVHRGHEARMSDQLDAAQPWPEHGRPEDAAAAAAFLASDDARFVTGQNLLVDGGLVAAGPRLNDILHNDPRDSGLSGVNRGSTGEESTVRNRSVR